VERDGYAQKRARAEEKHIGRPSKFAPYRLQLEARLAEECSKAEMKRRTKRVLSAAPTVPRALSTNDSLLERFLPGYTARRAVLRNRIGFTRLTYSVLFRTTSAVAMSGKRFLHRAGGWMMLVGVLLYGFADIAFLGEAVFGAGALLVLANAETYSQRKAEALTLLSKIGLQVARREKRGIIQRCN